MYGFAAFMSKSKMLGLWNCLTWTAGVSSSRWTLAAYYTNGNHDFSRLLRHYLSVTKESAHPMSLQALDIVMRSSKDVYFLIGPRMRKFRSGIIGLGIMDLYGTLTTTYQFLLREPGARLSRASFQFSKIWARSGIDKGREPMPIFTAVRRAPKDSSGVKPHTDSSLSKGQPPNRALIQHETQVPGVISGLCNHNSRDKKSRPAASTNPIPVEVPDSSLANGFLQWFEISLLEIGSPDIKGYIPKWSWGWSFVSRRSFGRHPEQSMALLLGQCTSAPARPFTGYISALLASQPKETFKSRLLLLLNKFVRMKKWERIWGNPIRAGHDPNPFFGNNQPQHQADDGMGELSSCKQDLKLLKQPSTKLAHAGCDEFRLKSPAKSTVFFRSAFHSYPDLPNSPVFKLNLAHEEDGNNVPSSPVVPSNPISGPMWESQGRIRLVDSGVSNNLPNHGLSRPERGADIIIAFDASMDVQTGSAIQQLQNFAEDCHLELEEQTDLFDAPQPKFHNKINGSRYDGVEVESKFSRQYARVFRGK